MSWRIEKEFISIPFRINSCLKSNRDLWTLYFQYLLFRDSSNNKEINDFEMCSYLWWSKERYIKAKNMMTVFSKTLWLKFPTFFIDKDFLN